MSEDVSGLMVASARVLMNNAAGGEAHSDINGAERSGEMILCATSDASGYCLTSPLPATFSYTASSVTPAPLHRAKPAPM